MKVVYERVLSKGLNSKANQTKSLYPDCSTQGPKLGSILRITATLWANFSLFIDIDISENMIKRSL